MTNYWSSSESSDTLAWLLPFEFGNKSITSKGTHTNRYVRPIRAFIGMKEIGNTEPVWIRDTQMKCKQVWINDDNKFQFSFIYPYRDNNWVRIYDMSGKMVYEVDMPYDNPNIIVELPDGMYVVKTFNDRLEPIQTFVIGK